VLHFIKLSLMACHPVLFLASSGHWLAWWMAAVQDKHPFSKPSSCMAQHATAVLACYPLSHIPLHVMPNGSLAPCTPLSQCCAQIVAQMSHDPAAIPLPDDLDLPGGVSPLRYPDWLTLAFHAVSKLQTAV
jgi:hypothetical protein